jgi:hypothetical protein
MRSWMLGRVVLHYHPVRDIRDSLVLAPDVLAYRPVTSRPGCP